MSRRKWVMRDGKLTEVNPRTWRPRNASSFDGIISDSAPFQTVDGDYIGGRASLREHEKKTGTVQVGNDYQPPPPHDVAVRQTRDALVKEYNDAGIPLEDSNVSWDTPEDDL
jgi:hypothetical protein|tara:strand:- start:692 stop:1027 length:336 start_codon:yes stop_codon:yes gene_type:complete